MSLNTSPTPETEESNAKGPPNPVDVSSVDVETESLVAVQVEALGGLNSDDEQISLASDAEQTDALNQDAGAIGKNVTNSNCQSFWESVQLENCRTEDSSQPTEAVDLAETVESPVGNLKEPYSLELAEADSSIAAAVDLVEVLEVDNPSEETASTKTKVRDNMERGGDKTGTGQRGAEETLSPEAEQPRSDVTDSPAAESLGVSKERGAQSSNENRSSPNDEVSARLEQELEQEMRYSTTLQKLRQVWELLPSKDTDTVMWSVSVLEQSVAELEGQLESLKNGGDELEDNEFRLRYEAQTNLNKKLEEQITWYNGEVLKMKERNKKGQDYSYDADLNDMNEFELAKLVKSLERERNNLYGDLRSKSWLLDNQSKEYYHFKELIKAYNGDLNHINRSLEHYWRQRARERAYETGAIPVTTPGSLKWSNGDLGIEPSQRILDPRKGPIKKTVGVRSLPRLDQEALESYEYQYGRKKRTKSVTSVRSRTKSLDVRQKPAHISRGGPRSADGQRTEDSYTSAEPASEISEDLTVESFTSSGN